MMPVRPSTLRTRLLSAIKILPDPSTAMAKGLLIDAAVARPPSPEDPATPLPATVLMVPRAASTWRMRLFRSAIRIFPDASSATALGDMEAEVAGPPSPENKYAPVRSEERRVGK